MKLQIQTFTGRIGEVEAERQHTILDLKKIIYKRLKIAGAVRVIKGQDVLPDGSTLRENRFTDGSTVNIVIKPVIVVNLHMQLGPKDFTCNVHNSMLVRDLKQQLIDGGKVGFSMNEFQLIVTADDNHRVAADIPLVEESLPLHMYRVGDNTTIRIVGKKVMIDLVGPGGHHWWKTFPRTTTIKQLKDENRYRGDFFKNISRQVSVWAFLQKGKIYKKLQDKATVGSVLTDNNVIHLVDYKLFPEW